MVDLVTRLRPKKRDLRPIGGGICEVELTRGFVALVDESDAAVVSVCNWYASFNGQHKYPYVKGKLPNEKRPTRLHRYLLGFPAGIVDHIDGDTLNNRRSNLRVASATNSNANTRVRRDSRLGIKGVRQNGRKFVTYISSGGSKTYLGTYPTALAAALAYDAEAVRRFGEFARTNASLGLLDSLAGSEVLQ